MATKISYILLLTLTALTTASIYNAPTNQELEQLRKQTDVLREKLITENCLNQEKNKRNLIDNSSDGVQFEAQSELYQHLVDLLIACRKAKQETTTTTAAAALPVECVNAINLTESWRLDHSGTDIEPVNGGWNCDTRDMINSGRPWFRFSASAGSKLLNSCPPRYSCGTVCGIWSNSTMPSQVGVRVEFTAYVACGRCDYYPRQVSVMRCSSAPSDFVYKYEDNSKDCWIGFCGMD